MSLKRYEYKLIDPAAWPRDGGPERLARIEEQLNALGRQGWEIVGPIGGGTPSEHGPLCLAKRKGKMNSKRHDADSAE